MVRAQRLGSWFLAVSLVITLAACIPPKPTREEVIGRWVEQRSRSKFKDDGPCAYFEFSENGRFEAHQMPADYLVWEGFRPRGFPPRLDTKGTWTLDTSSSDPFALHDINLAFDAVPGLMSSFTRSLSLTYPSPRALLAGVPDDPKLTFYKRDDIKCQ